MSLGPPPADLSDNKSTKDSPTELQGGELARYWLSAIIESADDAIISKTLDGIITSWNKGAERIFGYTAGEAIGQPVTILIPADHPDEEPAILARLRAGERIEHYETVRVRKDGTLVNISLTVSPIRGPDGSIIGASKIARDITDRKRAEEELHESKRQLEALLSREQAARAEAERQRDFTRHVLEDAPIAIGVMEGTDHRFTLVNRHTCELTGLAEEQFLGRPHREVVPEADKVVGPILDRVYTTGLSETDEV